VGVEGRDLVDLGERQPHFLRQRGEMRGGEVAVLVLNQMQMLDQQVAPARPLTEQGADLIERFQVDLTPLGRSLGRAPRLAVTAADAVASRRRRNRDVHGSSPRGRIEPFQFPRQSRAGDGLIENLYRRSNGYPLLFDRPDQGLYLITN